MYCLASKSTLNGYLARKLAMFVRVFDTEVVDPECEGDVPCFMEKEPFGVWGFVVAKFFQVCNEIVMNNFSGLF